MSHRMADRAVEPTVGRWMRTCSMMTPRIETSFLLALLACGPALAQTPTSRPTDSVTTCVTAACHAELLSRKTLHGPVAQKKCGACHAATDPTAHLFSLTVPLKRLCTFCHVQTYRNEVHQPVTDGDCTGCHDPHGSNHRALLVEDPAGGLCFRCHPAKDFASRRHQHGPVAVGACVVCHEPHSSWHPNLLVTSPEELCTLCHEDVQDGLETHGYVHEPVRKGQCLTCHDPHASDHPAQLRGSAPGLCFSCHEHDAIRNLIDNSSHVHGAITTEASCTACHHGHGGDRPKLLKGSLLTVCLSCHDKPIEAPSGKMLTDMAALLEHNPDHHGPVRGADCTACHNPHASPNFRLLKKDYPEMFYAPFELQNYDLCFGCHIKELVTEPGGVGVTGFRDGERNLHYLHVNKKEKGRTCRACHEVHASSRPFHIRDKVPFGGWEFAINFTAQPDGGRCAPGCHDETTYRRDSAASKLSHPAGLKKETKP